jgi:hypothetical protein
LQEEVQEREGKLQDHKMNRDNEIANLVAQIHQLQKLYAPAPVVNPIAPAANPAEAAPSFDVEDD